MDYQKIELGHPTAESEESFRVKRVVEFARSHNICSGTVVDLGCGYGAYVHALSPFANQVIGIEVEETRLQKAVEINKDRPNVDFLHYDGKRIPLASESVDNVMIIEVLEHVNNDLKTLLEIKRILKPGGGLLLSVPNKYFPFETHALSVLGRKISTGDKICFIPLTTWLPEIVRAKIATARVYTRKGLCCLIARAGFAIVKKKYMFMPLDKLNNSKITGQLRRIGLFLENIPGAVVFCAHLLITARKT
jgi:SAM-dependent methyltransferase